MSKAKTPPKRGLVWGPAEAGPLQRGAGQTLMIGVRNLGLLPKSSAVSTPVRVIEKLTADCLTLVAETKSQPADSLHPLE